MSDNATPMGTWIGLLQSIANAGIDIASTQTLRTFNGQALVERCYRAWRGRVPIHLEYRQSDGLNNEAPIIAARPWSLSCRLPDIRWLTQNTA